MESRGMRPRITSGSALVGDGELPAALATTGAQDLAAVLGGHALTKAVLVDALAVVRLKCAFHEKRTP